LIAIACNNLDSAGPICDLLFISNIEFMEYEDPCNLLNSVIKNKTNLIITDLESAYMDQKQLLKQLLIKFPDLPIMLVLKETNTDKDLEERETIYIFHKPYSVSEILKTIYKIYFFM
jgi:hypothetical protein